MLDRGQRKTRVYSASAKLWTDGQLERKKVRLVSGCIRNPRDASDGVETTEETLFTFTTCSQMFAYQKFLLETCVACRERILVQLYSVWHSC